MRHRITTIAGALALASSAAGCGDFLTGPGLTDDPNKPPAASTDQLFHGVQLTQYVQHTGDLARHAAIWMQQMAGIGNQLTGRGLYQMSTQDLAGFMDALYLGGGLLDMREIERRADAEGDRVYAGITRVWEAYMMGEAASLWGALPYSEAAKDREIPNPKFDPQEQVYAQVQALLDRAIADLESGAGDGPGAFDLSYGGDPAPWIEVAHTLNARFYLHWVEAQANAATAALANTACGGDCVEKALAAAEAGISSPENDFRAMAADAPNEENLWHQFIFIQRPGQIAAGKRLVELLRSRGDPRLTQYFRPLGGQVVGADPGEGAGSTLSTTRGAPDFRQPLATYAENELILAEARWRKGDEGAALGHLNNARAAAGLSALSGLSGQALFTEILTEKYIALFQNIEVWNDFKRTCVPALAPARGSEVIGRVLYSSNERNTNPNTPADPARNANDPNPCPAP